MALPTIGLFEGYKPTGYRDPAPGAYETVCYGHREEGVFGKTYTDDQCTALLVQDAIAHGTKIERCFSVSVPTKSLAAFIAFDFNTGAFCGSTVAKKLNAGDLAGACASLTDYNKARVKGAEWPCRASQRYVAKDGRRFCILPGLVRRRAAERKLCEEGLRDG